MIKIMEAVWVAIPATLSKMDYALSMSLAIVKIVRILIKIITNVNNAMVVISSVLTMANANKLTLYAKIITWSEEHAKIATKDTNSMIKI